MSPGLFFMPAPFSCDFVSLCFLDVLHCDREDQFMSESLAICIMLHAVLTQIGVQFEVDWSAI